MLSPFIQMVLVYTVLNFLLLCAIVSRPKLEQIELIPQSAERSTLTKAVVMRTLDVGGDKPLPYFSIIEENPFLGWRGIRLTLDHPEIFLVQIRAMLKANIGQGNLHILLPMISDLAEVDESLRLIQQASFEV